MAGRLAADGDPLLASSFAYLARRWREAVVVAENAETSTQPDNGGPLAAQSSFGR
jgi:hypothetical protein